MDSILVKNRIVTIISTIMEIAIYVVNIFIFVVCFTILEVYFIIFLINFCYKSWIVPLLLSIYIVKIIIDIFFSIFLPYNQAWFTMPICCFFLVFCLIPLYDQPIRMKVWNNCIFIYFLIIVISLVYHNKINQKTKGVGKPGFKKTFKHIINFTWKGVYNHVNWREPLVIQ